MFLMFVQKVARKSWRNKRKVVPLQEILKSLWKGTRGTGSCLNRVTIVWLLFYIIRWKKEERIRATQFCQWATSVLREFAIRGYVLE